MFYTNENFKYQGKSESVDLESFLSILKDSKEESYLLTDEQITLLFKKVLHLCLKFL